VQNLPHAPPRGGGNFLKNSKNRETLDKPADKKKIQWGNFPNNFYVGGNFWILGTFYTSGENYLRMSIFSYYLIQDSFSCLSKKIDKNDTSKFI
jgi:hypothetical protein